MSAIIKLLLIIVAVLALIFGVQTMYAAETVTHSAVHQIMGLIEILIGVVSMGFVGLLDQRS